MNAKRNAKNQSLPVYELNAFNYGFDHENKIHDDKGAAEYGFAGALVPGVAMYAYLTRPVIDYLGENSFAWLDRGAMQAKFIHPVYDGDKVFARGKVTGIDPVEMSLELRNQGDDICAFGKAEMPRYNHEVDSLDYPSLPLPNPSNLKPATIYNLKEGEFFGSLEFDPAYEAPRFLDDVREASPIYFGDNAVCHPAFLIAKANEFVMQNIALGPWIHTTSEVRHLGIVRGAENLSMRGRVEKIFEKRGSEYAVFDIAVFGRGDRPVAWIRHTAIIKLRFSGG